MIGDLEILVHVNLEEFSRVRSVSGNFDIKIIGQLLRVSCGELVRDRTRGLHRFSYNKFVSWM
jgi:hypothetical protein